MMGTWKREIIKKERELMADGLNIFWAKKGKNKRRKIRKRERVTHRDILGQNAGE